MTEQHRASAGRQGAWLFVAAGVVTLVNNVLFVTEAMDTVLLTVIGLASVAIGGIVALLPWGRWPDRALLAPVVVALGMVAVGITYGGVSDFSYSLYFVLTFIWLGLAQPPGTAVLLAPLATLAYLLPLLVGQDREFLIESTTVALPVCVLVGELIARQVRRLHDTTEEATRLAGMLGEASLRDALTGIGNRRYADAVLDDLRTGDVVVLADLDHFKRVNDTHGHDRGDDVLRRFADHLQRAVRAGDAVARWGGEEFLVVLRRHPELPPLPAAQRLVDGWRATGPVVTFSAGAAIHRTDRSARATVAAADRALYRAKAGGRDRLALDGGVAPLAQSVVNSAGAR